MAFQVSSLDLRSFRSYAVRRFDEFGSLNILVGPNGAGKTNVLEAIHLTTALRSFRSSSPSELVRWDDDEARVTLELAEGSRKRDITLEVKEGKKSYRYNGKATTRSNLFGTMPAVIFSPDDLRLVKEGATRKRKALDDIGTQISRNYRSVRHDYEKIIQQKNALLKERVSPTYLESVNDTVARVGTQLYLYRQTIVKEMSKTLQSSYRRMMGKDEDIRLIYEPSWRTSDESVAQDSQEALTELSESPSLTKDEILKKFSLTLSQLIDEEIAHARSLVGPHRDRPGFFINGRDASLYGSQGQQRSIALAFKLVELNYLHDRLGVQPLLLLDDVMSELDEVRRESLMDFIPDEVQTFITTTHLDYFSRDILDRAVIISL